MISLGVEDSWLVVLVVVPVVLAVLVQDNDNCEQGLEDVESTRAAPCAPKICGRERGIWPSWKASVTERNDSRSINSRIIAP